MKQDIRISNYQLALLLMGFVIGSMAVYNPVSGAHQDGWIALMIGLVGGFILLGVYIYISVLNPNKTLIEILKINFGNYLGSLIGGLYLLYFIHIAAMVVRKYSEFVVTVVYPQTPTYIVIGLFLIAVVYAVKQGLEVLTRVNELLMPFLFILVIVFFILLKGLYNPKFLFPILEEGLKPILKASLIVTTYPFGETVIFLMIFPFLKGREKIIKTSMMALAIVGIFLMAFTLRDIMVLGDAFADNALFPSQLTAKLIPRVEIAPLIAVILIIAGGVRLTISIFSISLGLTQLINLDDYKPFISPIAVLIVVLSLWIYDNIIDMTSWIVDYWPLYSLPFQVIIPVILLITSYLRRKRMGKV